jgi:hypothetical protein
MGFIVTQQQVKDWSKADAKNQRFLNFFQWGTNLAKNPYGMPDTLDY